MASYYGKQINFNLVAYDLLSWFPSKLINLAQNGTIDVRAINTKNLNIFKI